MKKLLIRKSKIKSSKSPYGIESEIGSLSVKTHAIVNADGKREYCSSLDFIPRTSPKESYRSIRYKELEYSFASTGSYRDTAAKLNRVRNQESGAKPTTVRNQIEREGLNIQEAKIRAAESAFTEHGFEPDGHKKPEVILDFTEAVQKTADPGDVSGIASELGVSANVSDYEDKDSVISISVDEVCCKQQAASRPSPNREKEPKQVRNTVIHVGHKKNGYIITGETVQAAALLLLGFLLKNNLLGIYPITFFADGAKNIKNTVSDYFGFVPYKYILDWPHLIKKTAELLSSSIQGRHKRNEVHEKLKLFLWQGDVAQSLLFLDSLSEDYIKSAEWLSKLKSYLKTNADCIPCYDIRKKLGLRVSSNIGEKANDIVVARRQKHDGMAWSADGSLGLAAICAAHSNAELMAWIQGKSIDFGFRSTSVA